MAIPRKMPAVLGTVAILATTALLVVHIVLAQSVPQSLLSVRVTAILSAVLEALALVALCRLFVSYLGLTREFTGLWFGVSLLLCALAAIISVAAEVCLSTASAQLNNSILGSSVTSFLGGSCAVLGITFASQLIFLVVHHVLSRIHDHRAAPLGQQMSEHARQTPQPPIKSIPYDQTSPNTLKTRNSVESKSPPGSSGGRSGTETSGSIRSSLSQVVRPISSKTKLLPNSQRVSRRPPSLDSTAYRSSGTEDGFDSWDTSAVDPQYRQTVLETSSPPLGRFLETIPASPTTSRSPSPGTPLDLEPPRRNKRRSRSYSPAPNRITQAQRAAFTQQATSSEAHIHPLFRSDSPTPPPIATPGTMVLAAPNAGQIISDRHSVRRMRSGSLPGVPSPLSRQGSFDDFSRRVERSSPELPEDVEEGEEGNEGSSTPKATASQAERKMTPPIPDWILSAGTRTSLVGYNSRTQRTPDPSDEGTATTRSSSTDEDYKQGL